MGKDRLPKTSLGTWAWLPEAEMSLFFIFISEYVPILSQVT